MLFKTTLLASVVFTMTFITDVCRNDDDCASGCCAFRTGRCAGAIIALERDGGCGFGSGTPNANAARKIGFQGEFPPSSGTPSPPPAQQQQAPKKKTFITDVCQNDDDCVSGCCGFNSKKCAGPVIAQTRDGGCINSQGVRNGLAARQLGFTGPLAPGAI
jgi:hypothetical protein